MTEQSASIDYNADEATAEREIGFASALVCATIAGVVCYCNYKLGLPLQRMAIAGMGAFIYALYVLVNRSSPRTNLDYVQTGENVAGSIVLFLLVRFLDLNPVMYLAALCLVLLVVEVFVVKVLVLRGNEQFFQGLLLYALAPLLLYYFHLNDSAFSLRAVLLSLLGYGSLAGGIMPLVPVLTGTVAFLVIAFHLLYGDIALAGNGGATESLSFLPPRLAEFLILCLRSVLLGGIVFTLGWLAGGVFYLAYLWRRMHPAALPFLALAWVQAMTMIWFLAGGATAIASALAASLLLYFIYRKKRMAWYD